MGHKPELRVGTDAESPSASDPLPRAPRFTRSKSRRK